MKLRVILQAFMLLFFMIMCTILCVAEYKPESLNIDIVCWIFGLSCLGILVNMFGLSRIKE